MRWRLPLPGQSDSRVRTAWWPIRTTTHWVWLETYIALRVRREGRWFVIARVTHTADNEARYLP